MTRVPSRKPSTTPTKTGDVEAFLAEVRARAPLPASGDRGRLMFALDATMSRQPTWDLARGLQGDMFQAAADVGGLDVQLVYYRGSDECRASKWVGDARALSDLMARIDCRGGQTQIARVLAHAADAAESRRVNALVFVGDAMEEAIDTVCAAAGPMAMRAVPAFMFQEGDDPVAEQAFREVARLTKGAYCRFGPGSAAELRALLQAVAAYASGGRKALQALAAREGRGAQRLLAQLG